MRLLLTPCAGSPQAFSQPLAAELLARQLTGGVTCAHVASAVAAASSTYPGARSGIVRSVVPLCADVATNGQLVRDVLSKWEAIVTAASFEPSANV